MLLLFFSEIRIVVIDMSFENIWNCLDIFCYHAPVYFEVWQQLYKKTTISYILTTWYINLKIFIMTRNERNRMLYLFKWLENSFGEIMGFLWESDTGNYERTHTAYLKCDLYLILLESFL